MRKMFLDNLPKTSKGINWKKSVGSKIDFTYDNIEGQMEICGYEKGFLIVSYLNKQFKIKTDKFKKCEICKLLGGYTKDFVYRVGQIIKDNKRNLVITKQANIKKASGMEKCYKYKCNICGFDCNEHYKNGKKIQEYYISESNLKNGNGCACCSTSSKIVVTDINSAWKTDRWLCELGLSEEDSKRYTSNSHNKVEVVCPYCDRKKRIRLSSLNTEKSIGCVCDEGASYPERVISNLLDQLKIEYVMQFSPKWANKRRYDFYIDSTKTIIEVHGRQHYDDNVFKVSLREQQYIDNFKRNIAYDNGIQHYIEIDASESSLECIKASILKSKLNVLFDVVIVDWEKIEYNSVFTNKKKKVCDYWSNKAENETTIDISRIFGISKSTTVTWLKQGNAMGWCKYDPKEVMKQIGSSNGKKSGKKIEVFKEGELLGVYSSINELERQSESVFGIKLFASNISSVCSGKVKSYKGYSFKLQK